MVKEQRRLQELRLAAAYNRALSESESIPTQEPVSVPAKHSVSGNGLSNGSAGNQTVQFREKPEFSESSQVSDRSSKSAAIPKTNLDSDVVQQIRNLLTQGYRIGVEHVDQRRFRTGSWQSCASLQTQNESEAIATLESCLAEHSDEYIRLFGVEPHARRRVLETIIQRPNC